MSDSELNDGWRTFSGDKEQHYCFREYSLCNKYDKLHDSYNDNDPTLHCSKCDELVGKLFALVNSVKTKDLKILDILKMIESKEQFDLKWTGLNAKVKTLESVSAVITNSEGKKKRIRENNSVINRIFNH